MALKPVKTVNANGEVKVGLADDKVTAPDLAGPAEKSLSGFNLRPEIMERAGEVFKEDAINNKDRPENGLLDFLTPRKSTQKGGGGKGRSTGTILDPYNLGMFGGRKAVIDKIIREGGQDLIDSYDPQTGKYSKLPQWHKSVDGVIDDDITKGLTLRQATQRKNTPEYRALTPEQKKGINPLTKTSDIIKGAAADTDLKNTKDTIRLQDNGGMWLDDYVKYELDGKAPTQSQLDTLLTEIKALQPTEIRSIQNQDNKNREIADQEQSTKNTDKYNMGALRDKQKQTALLEADQINKQLQQEWANNDATSLREHEASQLAAKYAHEASENDATRNIKMQIEMLGREDNREQRAYDRRRDERQDRQLMIMQMMKGLQQIGGSFSI